MLNKIKNFMNRPITWGDSIKCTAGVYAVWSIFLACYFVYCKIEDWKSRKELEHWQKSEERPEW